MAIDRCDISNSLDALLNTLSHAFVSQQLGNIA
jgi:hypothetical protein